MHGGIRRITHEKDGYSKMAASITHLEQTTEGLKFVTRLKSALRQHHSPSHGRKLCTFSFPNPTKASLPRLARHNQVTETEAITKLIDDAEWAARRHKKQEKKLRATLDLERKSSELTASSLSAQLDETLKHLERSTELLVMWEQTMESEQPPLDGGKENVKREVEKRMKSVKTINAIIAARYSLPSEA